MALHLQMLPHNNHTLQTTHPIRVTLMHPQLSQAAVPAWHPSWNRAHCCTLKNFGHECHDASHSTALGAAGLPKHQVALTACIDGPSCSNIDLRPTQVGLLASYIVSCKVL